MTNNVIESPRVLYQTGTSHSVVVLEDLPYHKAGKRMRRKRSDVCITKNIGAMMNLYLITKINKLLQENTCVNEDMRINSTLSPIVLDLELTSIPSLLTLLTLLQSLPISSLPLPRLASASPYSIACTSLQSKSCSGVRGVESRREWGWGGEEGRGGVILTHYQNSRSRWTEPRRTGTQNLCSQCKWTEPGKSGLPSHWFWYRPRVAGICAGYQK